MAFAQFFIALAILLGLSAPVWADDPAPPPLERLDNGDYSWARQVIPVLYGRKPLGYSEIRLVGDLARASGRRTTLLALMGTDEFVDHWTDVLMDHLRVGRQGDKSQESCYSEIGGPGGRSDALARWIRDNGPASAFVGASEFNMNEVVRSSLRLDDLSPIFLAHLFALQSQPIKGNQVTEANKRSDLWAAFEAVYLHRKNECLLCHNSSFSVTGAESFWNRAHPIDGHLERYVYGARTGLDPVRLRAYFRTDVLSGSIAPWGLGGCGSFDRAATDDQEPPKEDDPAGTGKPNHPFFAGLNKPKGSIFDVEGQLRKGFDALRENGLLSRSIDAADQGYCDLCKACSGMPTNVTLTDEQKQRQDAAASVLQSSCHPCHLPGRTYPALVGINLLDELARAPSKREGCALVSPRDKERSYLWQKVQAEIEGTCSRQNERMPRPPANPLSDEDLAKLEAWIAVIPENAGCRTCQRLAERCDPVPELRVEPDQGFALMTAAGMTNRVWREALGYPLTIANYFPRSQEQGTLVKVLTETTFIGNKFSLRELLVHILTSNYFNRRAFDPASGAAYSVPLVLDPWVEADPRRPPVALDGWTPGAGAPNPDPAYTPEATPQNHRNAATESIRRYPPYTLMRSAQMALGWVEGPAFFPDNPSDLEAFEYAKAAGLYIRDSEPGFRGVDLQSLLVWEARNGRCARPQTVEKDWIDRLVEKIGRLQSAGTASVTHREALAAVKDWLIGDIQIRDGREAETIARLFGWEDTAGAMAAAGFLDTPVKLDAALTEGLRSFCGILLQTPQFQLAGTALAELSDPPHDADALEPRLRVCNGSPCSYAELCDALSPHLKRAGSQAVCPKVPGEPAVAAERSPNEILASTELDALCPPGLCYLHKLPAPCRANPARCVEKLALCDPRVDSCGGPDVATSRLKALREGAVLVAELEGATVQSGQATRKLLHAPSGRVTVAGSRLEAGDVFVLKPGQAMSVELLPDPMKAFPANAVTQKQNWTLKVDELYRIDGADAQPRIARLSPEEGLTVIVTGPALRSKTFSVKTAEHPPWSAIASDKNETWLGYGEAGPPPRPESQQLRPSTRDLEMRRQGAAARGSQSGKQ